MQITVSRTHVLRPLERCFLVTLKVVLKPQSQV